MRGMQSNVDSVHNMSESVCFNTATIPGSTQRSLLELPALPTLFALNLTAISVHIAYTCLLRGVISCSCPIMTHPKLAILAEFCIKINFPTWFDVKSNSSITDGLRNFFKSMHDF